MFGDANPLRCRNLGQSDPAVRPLAQTARHVLGKWLNERLAIALTRALGARWNIGL